MNNPGTSTDFTGTDRFHVVKPLGAGSMGVVYEAIDLQRNAHVALKFLPQADPAALFAFKLEFRKLAGVSHSNLVGLYELFSNREQWFFTMELVNGVDWRTFVLGESSGSMPKLEPYAATVMVDQCSIETSDVADTAVAPHSIPSIAFPQLDDELLKRLRSTLSQLVEGLRALHAQGLVHRDIKPHNVLVRSDGRVVVLDFGLVSDRRGSNDEGDKIAGTVAYMSPEQSAGNSLTPATDYYSVGVMLYQLLTGRCPFEGSVSRVLLEKCSRDPVEPQAINPTVPDDLNGLIMALLSRDPQIRPGPTDILRWCGTTNETNQSVFGNQVSTSSANRFVGRTEQLARMKQSFETVRQGGTAVVLIRGESGVGKSALVQQVIEQLPDNPQPVILSGRCYEQESVPFKAFDNLIDMLTLHLERLSDSELAALLPRDVAALARIFPVVERIPAIANAPSRAVTVPDQMELRRRGFAALREMLARLGDRHPLILWIDDLQWGDVDSAILLNELLQPPDAPVMLVLGTYRAEDEGHSECLRLLNLTRTTEDSSVTRHVISLSPLTQGESTELALGLLDRDDPTAIAAANQIVRESKGSPYFLAELAQHVRDGIHHSPTTSTDAETEQSAPVDMKIRLDDALWRRIERLPNEARKVLEVLSVATRPLRLVDALKVACIGDSHAALARLRNDRFLRATGAEADELLAPYHDRIRETFVARLSDDVLRGWHLSLANTLAEGGAADAQTLATHFEGAGDKESAGRYYAASADEAASALAFEQAAKLYRKSLDLRPLSGEERFKLLESLADALANAGRGVDAARQYLEASKLAKSDNALELQSKAGFNFCAAGDIDSGRAALADVLKRLGTPLPRTRVQALVSLLWGRLRLSIRGIRFRERPDSDLTPEERMRLDVTWSVACGLTMIDTIRGADFQTRNLLLALKTGEPYRIARALAWGATHVAMDGIKGRRRTQLMLDTADAIAARLDNPHVIGMAMMSRGVSAFFLGDHREAVEVCDRAAVLFTDQCTGVAWELDTSNAFAYWASFLSGDLRIVHDRFPRLVAEAQQRGDSLAEANFTTYGGPFVFLARDDADGASRALTHVMGQWSQQDFHVQHFTTLSAHAFVNLYRGDGLAAWEHLHRQWKPLSASFLLQVEIVRIYLLAQRANCALAAAEVLDSQGVDSMSGSSKRWTVAALEREASRTARRLERERPSFAHPLAMTVRAALAYRHGRRDDAIQILTKAVSQLDAQHMKLVGASARFQLGKLLGDPEGRKHIEQAEKWMRENDIVCPDRIANVFVAGFGPVRSESL